MAYTICAGILGIIASVFPVVYLGIKLIRNHLDTSVVAEVSMTHNMRTFYIYLISLRMSDCC